MVEYPDTLPKPLYEGHTLNPSQPFFTTEMDYGQKSRAKYFGTFPIKFVFNFSEEQLNTFNSWFWGNSTEQLNGGAKPFSAQWIILGINTTYEFQFAKGGQPKYKPSSPTHYKLNLTVNLLTDISEIIALNSLDGWCPEIIDCQRDFLIAAS